jgi:hypothetical protein
LLIYENSDAQTTTTEKLVEQSLSTETDQAITAQTSQIRFEDTARVIEQTDSMKLQSLFSSINPFPEDTPTSLLERVVQLPDITWGPGYTTQTIDVLEAIINTSSIHQSILGFFQEAMYRYLRCDWKVTIRLNSTPYHQGCMIVNWLPSNYVNTSLPGDPIVALASINNTILLSASQQDQCTLNIPYFSYNPHYDLSFALAVPWIQPRINIAELNPLRTSSASVTDSIPISIWVQMVNIHTYGILDATSLTKTGSHSNKNGKSPIVISGAVKQSAKGRTNKEAQTKDVVGESAKGVVQAVAPLLHSVPIISDIINFGKNLFGNLDKPSTDQVVTFMALRQNRGHTHLTGVDYSESLSSFPTYQVSKDVGIESTSDMTAVQYCQLPALFYKTSVTTKGVVLTTPVHPNTYANSTRTEVDYLAYMSAYYRFWRGSIKFLVQFVGTPFYSCRFKLSVVYSAGPPPGGTGNGTGFMSRIVDVKGDAWTSFTVPYLSQRVWQGVIVDSTGYQSRPYLIIEALTDVQGSSLPADAIYYVNIWRAAGPDYQLSLLQHYSGDMTPLVITGARKESSLQDKWNQPSEGIQTNSHGFKESGLYMADQSSTITDQCKRFVVHSNTLDAYAASFPGVVDSTMTPLSPFHLHSTTFLFWRGSRRLKYTNNTTGKALLQTLGQAGADTGDAIVLSNVDNQQVTIPWYSTELVRPTTQATSDYTVGDPTNTPSDVAVTGWNSGGATTYIAGGDDFCYYWIVPPNPKRMIPTPSITSPTTTTTSGTRVVIKADNDDIRPSSNTSRKPEVITGSSFPTPYYKYQ